MIIPKKIYEELVASRDEYIEKYKQLVKRNTPMKTVEKKMPHVGEEEREHYCPNCNKFLGFQFQYRHKFCRECGQALKYKEEIE